MSVTPQMMTHRPLSKEYPQSTCLALSCLVVVSWCRLVVLLCCVFGIAQRNALDPREVEKRLKALNPLDPLEGSGASLAKRGGEGEREGARGVMMMMMKARRYALFLLK